MKTLVFDMDGTIADLYGVADWLENLRDENPKPYIEALPLVSMTDLGIVLNLLKETGWRIVVTSWLSKNSSEEYKRVVRQAKKEWLKRYCFPFDEIHLVQYGTTKAKCTRHHGGFQILIDDNEKVRKGWHLGDTINANDDIISELIALLLKEE